MVVKDLIRIEYYIVNKLLFLMDRIVFNVFGY